VRTIVLIDAASGGRNVVDVLDRVLDKGIVVNAWMRVALMGIDFVTIEARVVVASIETYLKHADVLAHAVPSVPGWVASHQSDSVNVRRAGPRAH
jgi:gas vesicle protein GvpA/GvpJ/GvpM family